MKASIIGFAALVLVGVLWMAIQGSLPTANRDVEAPRSGNLRPLADGSPMTDDAVTDDAVTDGTATDGTATDGTATDGTATDDAVEQDTVTAATADDAIVLAEAKQKQIWDAEHVTFELESFFGKAFQQAIRDRRPEDLAGFFVDDPDVALIPLSAGDSRLAATVAETRAGHQHAGGDDAENPAAIDGDLDALIDLLIESAESVGEITRTKFRVLQLQRETDTSWTARILILMEGRDAEQHPRTIESEHRLELAFENDSQIRDGQIVTAWRDLNRSIRQAQSPLLREVTYQVGLDEAPLPDNWKMDVSQRSQYWFQLAVEDFNRDGYPDIAAATIDGRPLLLQSDAGKDFVDVTDVMEFQSWDLRHMRALATWIDFDNDQWPDLLLGDRLYQNIEGKMFLDATEQSGLQFGHFPMGTAVADYDCDGLLDLYVLYQHEEDASPNEAMPWVGDTQSGKPNELWKNLGGGRFKNVTEESNASGGNRHSFAAVWHFLDDDHYPDLYVANDFGQNVHLRNRGDGTFEDLSEPMATADFATSMGVSTGDLNNDGHPELYVANMFSKMGRRIIGNVCGDDYPAGIYEQIVGSCAGNRLYTLSPEATSFLEISEQAGVNEVGWAYAPTLADFDSDGLLDIYATTGFMSFQRGKPDG